MSNEITILGDRSLDKKVSEGIDLLLTGNEFERTAAITAIGDSIQNYISDNPNRNHKALHFGLALIYAKEVDKLGYNDDEKLVEKNLYQTAIKQLMDEAGYPLKR